MTLVVNPPGATGSEAQMAAPRGVISAMVPVTPLVTLCSWRLLSTPSICSTPLEFMVLVLLWNRLPAQTCFYKCPLSRSAPAEVPGLELVLQRSLALIYTLGCPRLRYARTHRGPGSGLLSQRSQTHVLTGKGFWFLPTSLEVSD